MPVKFPCTSCKKACKECKKEGQESICCNKCSNWVHFRCTNEPYEYLTNPEYIFTCERCFRTCPICEKLCRKNQKFIPCSTCKFQYHEKCIPYIINHAQRFDCSFCCINPT